MKRFIILMVLAVVCASAVGQDLLVKRNGEQMRVKVLKITKKNVQFVRHGTELPVYTLPISDIEYIQYPMGDRDTFGKVAEPAPAPTPVQSTVEGTAQRVHGPVPPPSVVENVVGTSTSQEFYSVGDIYEKDGIKGIVALLYDGGRHGVVMSLDEACVAWSKLHRKKLKATGASSATNGMDNMVAIEKYIAENGLSWSDFPAFEWCRNKGEGWYLPSINELWCAGTMYMGGSRTSSDRKFRKAYNQNLEVAGGKPLSNIMIYHSSTEDSSDARYSQYSHMNSETPYTQSGFKADELFVRAFYKF